MPANHHFALPPALAAVALVALAGCSSPAGTAGSLNADSINPVSWITPYKADVIQGNFVSKEQVEQLRAGMTREQVKALMGTPLLTSLFHADRWDYVFTLKRQGVQPQAYKYTVYFKGDALERFAGDAMPSETEFIAQLVNRRKLGKVPPLEATEAQLKAAEKPSAGKPDAAQGATTDAPAAEPATAYPPLESPAR